MSVTPITIDGSAGGTIYDQAGEVVIQLGAAAATVVAGLGTDTIVGAEGSILVNATEDANPLLVQPGVGTASVFAGAGTLSVLSADGSQIIDFTGPPDHFYLVTTDGLTVVTTVSDGSGTDTIMGGSLTYTQAGTMWTPPTLPGGGGTDTTGGGGTDTTGGGGTDTTGGGGTDTTGGGGTDTTGGGGTDTTGGGVPGVPDPFGGLGGSGLYTTLETTFTTLLGDGWNNGGANFVVFGPGDTPPVTQPGDILTFSIPGGSGGNVTVPGGTELVVNHSGAPIVLAGGTLSPANVPSIGSNSGRRGRGGGGGGTDTTGGAGSGGSSLPAGTIVVDAGGDIRVTVNAGAFVDATPEGSDSGNADVTALAGSVVVTGNGNDTISAPSGNNSVDGGTGNNLFVLGSGLNVVFSSGQDTVRMGSGNATVTGNDTVGPALDILVQGGVGQLQFHNGAGNATVTAGTGSVTVDGGLGGGLFQGGSAGNNLLITGAQASTLVGGGSGDRLLVDNSADNVLRAGAGNATLDGSQGSGNNRFSGGTTSGSNTLIATGAGDDTVIGGAGRATIIGSGGTDVIQAATKGGTIVTGEGNETITLGRGKDLVAYVNGTAGGQDLIAGFNSRTDRIVLSGYGSGAIADAVSSAHAVSGGIAFSLSDGTQVTVVGVTRLTSASFQLG